jgi:eukaryotic-like serine/threonine-protein kinase
MSNSTPPPSKPAPVISEAPSPMELRISAIDFTEPPPDPWLGRVLDSKYRIDSYLASGGMGAVYLGRHLGLDAPVAVKVMHGHANADAALRERFRREAVALAKVKHPSIVAVHDFGEVDGDMYIVMEHVTGVTLATAIEGPPLAVPMIGEVFDLLLRAIASVHEAGIIHRDLKPDNVFLVERNGRLDHIKIIDFGLAYVPTGSASSKRLTETGQVHGTPHYMSPEQCRGLDVGPPTDVYAIGCMLYESISGVVPFDGSDTAQLLAQQLFVEAPPIASVGHKRAVSRGIEGVIRRALAKKTEQRSSLDALRTDLSAALRGLDAET